MYAPIGFMPFMEVRDIVHGATDELMPASSSEFNEIYKKTQSESGVASPIALREILIARKLFNEYQCNKILVQQPFPIYISSPGGTVMRVAPLFFNANDSIGLYPWEAYLPRNDELAPRLCDEFQSNEKSKAQGHYWFLDETTCLIASQRQQLLERDALENAEAIGFSNLERYVEPFEGWSVCVKEGDMPEDYGSYIEAMDLQDAFSDVFEDEVTRKIGRPRERDNAASIYRELHPEGHDCTWSEVEKRVGYSKRTIQRGLSGT